MSPKEKAVELIEKFKPMFNIWDYYNDCPMDSKIVKENTIECINEVVNEIIKGLDRYGEDSMELQNMENEFRYYEKVKQELNKL